MLRNWWSTVCGRVCDITDISLWTKKKKKLTGIPSFNMDWHRLIAWGVDSKEELHMGEIHLLCLHVATRCAFSNVTLDVEVQVFSGVWDVHSCRPGSVCTWLGAAVCIRDSEALLSMIQLYCQAYFRRAEKVLGNFTLCSCDPPDLRHPSYATPHTLFVLSYGESGLTYHMCQDSHVYCSSMFTLPRLLLIFPG